MAKQQNDLGLDMLVHGTNSAYVGTREQYTGAIGFVYICQNVSYLLL